MLIRMAAAEHRLFKAPSGSLVSAFRAGLLITALFALAPGCKLITPDSFLDPTPDSNELLKSMNVRNNGELWSGVVAGDLPAGVTGVDVKFDDGPRKKAEITGNRWRVFIPTGAEAAAGKQRWQVGSRHQIAVFARGQNGNSGRSLSLSFFRQQNKDVNGDGYSDGVIGAYRNQGSGAADKGVAYVVYGSADGVANHLPSASAYVCAGPPDCNAIQNPENESSGTFGISVAFAGDANGDGYADVIVGAYGNQGAGAADKGVAYLFYGSAAGVTNHPTSASPFSCTGAPDCSVIQNPDNKASGYFGLSVSSAGDANGDGYADLLVGAMGNQGLGASSKGVAYVFYGSSAGVINHPTSGTAYTCTGPPDCSVVQNPENEASGYFGISVSYAGDMNGDGYGDVVVGAYQNQGAGAADKGAAYVYYGSVAGIASHPTSASSYSCSGVPDCAVLQNPDNEVTGNFGISVSYAGDTNGDGFTDVVVGAINNQGAAATNKGVVYVFFGSVTGATTHPLSASAYTCNGIPDCSTVQNPDDENAGAFGTSVSFAGDINHDGFGEIVIGAVNNQGVGAPDKGVVYVFYGSSSGVVNHPTGSSSYVCNGLPDCSTIQNPDDENLGYFGNSVSVFGDANGDGYTDLVIGSHQNQGGGAADKGTAYIFYGSATGVTSHPTGVTTYACNGPPDCSVIQNPDDESSGNFGYSVGFLAPALRPSPASLNHPRPPSPFMGRGWGWGQDALPARREEDLA